MRAVLLALFALGVQAEFVTVCSDEECNYSSDGDCDDGGDDAEYSFCELGYDCEDCGPRDVPTISPPPDAPPPPTPPMPPPEPPFTPAACEETCNYASDGLCDDCGPDAPYCICPLGTDCTDCGPRGVRPSPPDAPSPPGLPPSPMFPPGAWLCTNGCYAASDGDCDDGGPGTEYSACSLGTDCDDCGLREALPPVPPSPPPPPSPPFSVCLNECHYASDNDCDDGGPGAEYDYCDKGYDCLDCGYRYLTRFPILPDNVRKAVGVAAALKWLQSRKDPK